MKHQGLTLAFAELFAGRTDAYGEGDKPSCTKKPVTLATWDAHLWGDTPIGVYPMRDDGMVKWGCIDFDNGEGDWGYVAGVQEALMNIGHFGWIERSRSKGYHLWVFADGWVPGWQMRRSLMAGCVDAEYVPREVNPKQEYLDANVMYGNYLRLPYSCHHTPGRQVALGWECKEMPLHKFVEDAVAMRSPVNVIAETAKLWTPPVVQRLDYLATALSKEITDQMDGLTHHVFVNGPSQGRKRGDTLMRLAYLLAENTTMDAGAAMSVMVDANDRWGKADEWGTRSEHWLELMIQKAWSAHREE